MTPRNKGELRGAKERSIHYNNSDAPLRVARMNHIRKIVANRQRWEILTMPESFKTIAKDTVESIGGIAPCPLLVTDAQGLVVGASPPDAVGST